MDLTLTVDPDQPDEIRKAVDLLDSLLARRPQPDLARIIGEIAHPKYGASRRGYLAAVAAAGDAGAPVDELTRDYFGGSHHAFGGTHAAIERNWRARGGQAIASKLIDETAGGAEQVMVPEARELVLACVDLLRMQEELAKA